MLLLFLFFKGPKWTLMCIVMKYLQVMTPKLKLTIIACTIINNKCNYCLNSTLIDCIKIVNVFLSQFKKNKTDKVVMHDMKNLQKHQYLMESAKIL